MSRLVTIVLDGPGKNALGTGVMQTTLDAVRAAGGKPILLTGKGDSFSAGLNLKEIATLDEPGLGRFVGLFDDLVVALLSHDAPLVAAVNGHAIAGGCFLLLCADYRVVTANAGARIGLTEVPMGLPFPPRAFNLAKARIPPHALHRVLLEGATHAPEVAKELGIVDEVAGDPVTRGHLHLEQLAASPRAAYAHTRRALNRSIVELSEVEKRVFEKEMLPLWMKRRAELVATLAR